MNKQEFYRICDENVISFEWLEKAIYDSMRDEPVAHAGMWAKLSEVDEDVVKCLMKHEEFDVLEHYIRVQVAEFEDVFNGWNWTWEDTYEYFDIESMEHEDFMLLLKSAKENW